MRTRNTLIVIAIILIALNALSYWKGDFKMPEDGIINKIAYLTGRNISMLLGLILLFIAYLIHRKVKRKKRKEMVDVFLK